MADPINGAAEPETPIPEDAATVQETTSTALETTDTDSKSHTPHSNRTGWDGKLRVNGEKQAVLANPEALEDSDYEDEDAPPVDQIAADEGTLV
jgi:protein phosphatase 1 regulatory subunit 7